jgi:hypothetical protein
MMIWLKEEHQGEGHPDQEKRTTPTTLSVQ